MTEEHMTDRELMQQALEALELLARCEHPLTKIQVRKPRDGGSIVTVYPHQVATDAAELLRERLAQPEQCTYPDCKCATENPCLKGLAQPLRTHWEGCDEVHPECKQPEQEPHIGWVVRNSQGNLDLLTDLQIDSSLEKYERLHKLYTAPPRHSASRPRHQCDKETEMTDCEDIPLGYTSAGGWREYHRDADGKAVTVKESNGDWYECTSDERGNVLKYRNSKDNWYEYTRDANGNVLTFKTSDGYWFECTRDSHGNVLTRRDSNGDWCEYTRDAHGKMLTYWKGRKANREWVGLTDAQVSAIADQHSVEGFELDIMAFARSIEAKLKEKNT